jgi:hypothetical protein
MDAPAGSAQGDAEGGPDGARADDADDRRLAALAPDVGMGVVVLVDLSTVAVVAGRQRIEVDPRVLDRLHRFRALRALPRGRLRGLVTVAIRFVGYRLVPRFHRC